VDDLPDDWLDAFDAISRESGRENRKQAVRGKFEQFEGKMGYRSYLN
jgi:metal-responsive CopG/Arc/MetJ family transcriptional regulator